MTFTWEDENEYFLITFIVESERISVGSALKVINEMPPGFSLLTDNVSLNSDARIVHLQ